MAQMSAETDIYRNEKLEKRGNIQQEKNGNISFPRGRELRPKIMIVT